MPPAARRSRRRKDQQGPQWEPVQWPLFSQQVELLAAMDPGEVAAAEHRALVLVEQGAEALLDWLVSPLSPAEQAAAGRAQQGQQQGDLLSVFD